MNFFATTPKGLELLLVEELRALGAESAAEKLAGVVFTGDLSVAYKACLWSRLANRILMPLTQVPAATPEELYAGAQTIQWDEHLKPDATLHINFVTSQSNITHTLFGAQKVKDAIVDQLREKYNTRPTITRENPDVSIHIYLHKNIASISIDLSGESLHKRGIRVEHGIAPLKENLAAAILYRSSWKPISASGGMLIDPMCGSGTFLIEAAQIAGNIAPGLSRDYFGFIGWNKHDASLWKTLLHEAKQQQDLENIPTIIGYDSDPRAIKIAFANIERAGLLGKIHVEKRELSECAPSKKDPAPGLIIMNPPYGERLGEESELKILYETIGAKLKNDFPGWHAAIFTGNPDLGKNMGLRARRHYALFNGAIPCQLLLFDVKPEWFVDRSPESANERRIRKAQRTLDDSDRHAAQMFANRLQKNIKHLKRWAEREGISCYRLYDADLPEYAVSIDRYESPSLPLEKGGQGGFSKIFIAVKEYSAPKSIDKIKAERRVQHVLAVLPEVLEVSAKNIILLPQRMIPAVAEDVSNMEHYFEKISNHFQQVQEGQLKFLINLHNEHLEIGLPLYQRLLRPYIQSIAKGKHCLNLFSRSGTTTVPAILGGAQSMICVDPSELYLEWSKRNLSLNNILSPKHQFIPANPIEWVENQKNRFDLIIAELPESSHRLRDEFHVYIESVIPLLRPQGILILTSRDPRFKLNLETNPSIIIENITNRFVPPDYAKQARAFPCWKIENI